MKLIPVNTNDQYITEITSVVKGLLNEGVTTDIIVVDKINGIFKGILHENDVPDFVDSFKSIYAVQSNA